MQAFDETRFDHMSKFIQEFKNKLHKYLNYTNSKTYKSCFHLYMTEGEEIVSKEEILLAHQLGLISTFDFESNVYHIHNDGYKILFDLGYFRSFTSLEDLFTIARVSPFLFKKVLYSIKNKFDTHFFNNMLRDFEEFSHDASNFDSYAECHRIVKEMITKSDILVDKIKTLIMDA